MERISQAEAAIRKVIGREGRITFRRFMEMALYSAPGAYYNSEAEKIGPRGDYFTSPEVHPSFGALLARQIEQVWVAMGCPTPFTLVEMGGGKGSLARDLLHYTARWASPFHEALRYILLERSSSHLRRQRETLRELGNIAERVAWPQGTMPDLGELSLEGCFLSNELPDSFPVHRVTLQNGHLREVYVELRDGELVEREGEISDPRLVLYFERLNLRPPEGCYAEVNLEALDWMAWVARTLRRGAVLTLDYGLAAEELYSRRHCSGTLLCFYRHTLNSDPYLRVGRQDMTTHVDFTSLSMEGNRHGLHSTGIASQRNFLSALGMNSFLDSLTRAGLTRREYEANWVAIQELLNPSGLGRVKVLFQQRGLDGFTPAGLGHDGLRHGDLGREFSHETVPLLTTAHIALTAPAAEPFMDVDGMWQDLMGEDEP